MEMSIVDTTADQNGQLSELSQRVLKAGIDLITNSIRTGNVPEWGPLQSVAFVIGDDTEQPLVGYVHKDELEKTLEEMRIGKDRVSQKVINRCKGPTPHAALRVLLITPDISVACLTGAPEDLAKLPNLSDSERAQITKQIKEVLDPYPEEVQRDALIEALSWTKDLEAILNTYDRMVDGVEPDEHEPDMDSIKDELKKLFVPFRRNMEDMERRARKVEIPPNRATPSNIEALAMALAYVLEPITPNLSNTKVADYALSPLIQYSKIRGAHTLHKLLDRAASNVESLYPKMLNISVLLKFASEWMRCGFARLEIGHKLAASLALTDVPEDMEVLHPWTAWSLVVPDGLLGNHLGPEGEPAPISRIWCMGTDPVYFVSGDGGLTGPCTPELFKKFLTEYDAHGADLFECIMSLVKGACLALDDPDEYKKQTLKSKTANSKPKQNRDGLPDFGQSRFMLSAPVQVDVREHLLDLLNGKKRKGGGGAPTVQFFVRGHWRNQAHGPGRSLRKRLRIEGFWKGTEGNNIALRNYKVKDDQ